MRKNNFKCCLYTGNLALTRMCASYARHIYRAFLSLFISANFLVLDTHRAYKYLWYNNVLRFCKNVTAPAWLGHIAAWKTTLATEETPFVTTLHVLNSAILKLSKVQKARMVFRGNQGLVLPREFWEPNEDNVRGGIELGFMSTTTDPWCRREVQHGEQGQV
jgi:hypothetical protein